MKKKNKEKFKLVWNKIKKPLMILSFVGNILFLLFIIVGCVGVKNKSSVVYAEDTLVNLTGTEWNLNADVNTADDFTFSVNFISNSQTYSQLHITYGYDAETIVFYDSLEVFDQNGGYWINDSYRVIYFSSGNDVTNSSLINWLYNNAELVGEGEQEQLESTFLFNKQINYNAPARVSLESPFFTHSFGEGELGYEIIYDFPYFTSNNEVFNRIRVWNWKGYAVRYLDSNGIIRVNDNELTSYYGFMQYINTETGFTREVNYRNSVTTYVGGVGDNTQSYIDFGSEWTNDNYRRLDFNYSLNPQQVTNLSQFNNQNFGSNGFEQVSDDVGLGSVFTLVSSGFGAFVNIFKIELLPGVSIGLLFFLPLVVGMIIFIIWLVKR